MDSAQTRKRGRIAAGAAAGAGAGAGVGLNGNGAKRNKQQDTESFPGIGSKSKPCTKFFSTAGCPFGEGCHFQHHVPGGINAVAHLTNLGGNQAVPLKKAMGPPSYPDTSTPPAVKTKMCNKFNTAEGCKFGEKCHFAHDERELGVPTGPVREDPRGIGLPVGRFEQPSPGYGAAASFGASATAKISVDASLAGAIIGKGGANSKQIRRNTGAKLSIRDHDSDPNLRNIELEGTFDQIKQASAMVRQLILDISSSVGPITKPGAAAAAAAAAPPPIVAKNLKTKLCENFTKGTCTFGERCHFAHGAAELRKQGV